MATSRGDHPRRCSTICLPFDQECYPDLVADPAAFRAELDRLFALMPELFPEAFTDGYRLKGTRTSAKLGVITRRVRCRRSGQSFTVRPSFVMPYMTGLAGEVQGPLFLRCFGVPFWALARAFGKNPMFWYRMEVGLGRNSIAGTTLRKTGPPEHLLADEHHTRLDGQKHYVATTVGDGCCLGAGLARSAGVGDLTEAYGVFQKEAEEVRPGYSPRTVNVDGWSATKAAWLALFPLAVLIRCFLHGWLAIRCRGKLAEGFRELSKKVWDAFGSSDRRTFAQRLRRLRGWANANIGAAWVREKVSKLCSRGAEYGRAYRHPGCHRTSNMLDRVMRGMNRYLESGQHLHGSAEAGQLHVRAWALVHNFRPWHPQVSKDNRGWASPAERLNRHRYHDDWLQNLLISASLGGHRR